MIQILVVLDSEVASALDYCESRDPRFKSTSGQKFGFRFIQHLHPVVNSALISALTVHCWREDEMTRER